MRCYPVRIFLCFWTLLSCLTAGAWGAAERYFLTEDSGAANNYFGWSVAADSGVTLSAALTLNNGRPGKAYLYDTTQGTQLHVLSASDGGPTDYFGFTTGISGNLAIVGIPATLSVRRCRERPTCTTYRRVPRSIR